MNKEAILKWLMSTDIPLTAISKKANISRKTLYNWINGGEVRVKSLNKLINIYKTEIEFSNAEISLDKGNNMEAQYIIDLQKEKIERLEEVNSQLKQNAYSVQSKKWDELSYDFYSDVYVTFVPFKRVVKEMSGHGVEQLSEMLEIDKDILLRKYFAVNEWHNFNEHPVNDIIEPNTLKELQEQSVQMPSLFESLKLLVGEHYFQQLITYKHNDKLVHSLCNIRIHWLNKPHRAECKTQFILSQ